MYNVINRRVIVAKKNEESDPKTISPDSSNDQSNKADTTESLDGCSPYPKEPEDCSLTNSDGNDDEESQTEREEMVVSQSVSNPSVVVSTEDETQSSSGVKRSIGSDEGNEPPRKIPNQKENSDQQL